MFLNSRDIDESNLKFRASVKDVRENVDVSSDATLPSPSGLLQSVSCDGVI